LHAFAKKNNIYIADLVAIALNSSVAEPHNFDAAKGKNLDAAPAALSLIL
jgi:hypothetical protein